MSTLEKMLAHRREQTKAETVGADEAKSEPVEETESDESGN